MYSCVTAILLFNIVPNKNEAFVITQNQLSISLLIEDNVLQLQTLNLSCFLVSNTSKLVASNIFL